MTHLTLNLTDENGKVLWQEPNIEDYDLTEQIARATLITEIQDAVDSEIAAWQAAKDDPSTETVRHGYDVINDVGKIGSVYCKGSGPYKGLWFFVPFVSGRTGSRRGRATADGSVPVWAKKMGGKLV